MRHFLIIDDDVVFTNVLSRSLARKGYQVRVANDGQKALGLLREADATQTITHIVLDLKLAETTGLQLMPHLLAVNPDLKIVVLTGYATVATTVDAIKGGAINYLCKPATIEEILRAFEDDSASRPASTALVARSNDSTFENALSVERVEWEYIQRQLAANNGNIAATARALGMHRRTLQRKLQKRPGKFS